LARLELLTQDRDLTPATESLGHLWRRGEPETFPQPARKGWQDRDRSAIVLHLAETQRPVVSAPEPSSLETNQWPRNKVRRLSSGGTQLSPERSRRPRLSRRRRRDRRRTRSLQSRSRQPNGFKKELISPVKTSSQVRSLSIPFASHPRNARSHPPAARRPRTLPAVPALRARPKLPIATAAVERNDDRR